MKKGYVKTAQKTIIKISDFQETLINYPSSCNKEMDDYGQAYLSNCVHETHKCGCEIVGNGTIQFPLSIKFCKKHKKVN